MDDRNKTADDVAQMPPATLKALQGSIAKWEAIAAGKGVDDGCDNCPLCLLFWANTDHDGGCEGCPVFEKTDEHLCVGTPYIQWHKATGGQCATWPRRAKTVEQRRLARAEVDFLKSLLPGPPT